MQTDRRLFQLQQRSAKHPNYVNDEGTIDVHYSGHGLGHGL